MPWHGRQTFIRKCSLMHVHSKSLSASLSQQITTRKHSSRMRNARLLTVCVVVACTRGSGYSRYHVRGWGWVSQVSQVDIQPPPLDIAPYPLLYTPIPSCIPGSVVYPLLTPCDIYPSILTAPLDIPSHPRRFWNQVFID